MVNSRYLDPDYFEYGVAPVGSNIAYEAGIKETRDFQKWFIDHQNGSSVVELSNRDCISAYGTGFVSGFSGTCTPDVVHKDLVLTTKP